MLCYLLEVKLSKCIPVQETLTATLRFLHWESHLVASIQSCKVLLLFRNINIPILADVVQHCTNLYNLADFGWRTNSDLAVQDMEASLQLPDTPLDNTAGFLVCPE